MILSLVKRPAAAGQLSRIGDYLLLQHEGLDSGDDLTDAAQYERHRRRMGIAFPRSGTMTRSPPHPLFHRSAIIRDERRHRGGVYDIRAPPGSRPLAPRMGVPQRLVFPIQARVAGIIVGYCSTNPS